MTFVSKLALAAALTLGGTALSVTPAAAQKKDDKAQAGPQLKVSEAFRKAAAPAETSIKAKDWTGAEANLVAAEAVAKNNDEKYYAAYLRLQQELGKNNLNGQMQALSVLIGNPVTPPDAVAGYSRIYYYQIGVQASAAKKYPEAITNLNKARDLGNQDVDIPIVLANVYATTNRPAESIAEVEKAIAVAKASGSKAPEAWYQFAIPKVNATGDRAAMASWLSRYLTDYPTVKNWHWAITVYRQSAPAGANERVEKLDGYRLMRATNSLPNRGSYADYAFAAQQAGLPWEAVAVIDEGRKSGKIPAGDADVAKTYASAQTGVKGEGSLDALAKQANAAKDGKAAAQTGDAFLASGNSARAVELYDIALTKGGINADEVNLHRGIAFQQLGRKEEARTAFGQVKSGPLANLATLFTTSLDLPPLS